MEYLFISLILTNTYSIHKGLDQTNYQIKVSLFPKPHPLPPKKKKKMVM